MTVAQARALGINLMGQPVIQRGLGICQSGEEPECNPPANPCGSGYTWNAADSSCTPIGGGGSVPPITGPKSGVCFQFGFPWVGKYENQVCKPAFNVESPWGSVITATVIAIAGFKVLRGLR
jgi:hypothetical protein